MASKVNCLYMLARNATQDFSDVATVKKKKKHCKTRAQEKPMYPVLDDLVFIQNGCGFQSALVIE